MEFLNIGPMELIFIALIALIVLGPDETVNTLRKLGRWLYLVRKSPLWNSFINTSKEIRDLPQTIVREAGLEESLNSFREINEQISGNINKINFQESSLLPDDQKLSVFTDKQSVEPIVAPDKAGAGSEPIPTETHPPPVIPSIIPYVDID